MKKYVFLLLLLLILNSTASFAQSDYLGFDKECFLIGTLSDYLGHEQTLTNEGKNEYFQRVDVYAQQEKKIANLTNSLFKETHPDLKLDSSGTSRKTRLHSATLSKIVDSYYTYQPSDNKTPQGAVIYTGTLNPEKIKTKKQKLSFLAGAYLRNGGTKLNDTKEPPRYMYDIPNSLSKAALCEQFLKDLGCKDVEEYVNEHMPTKKEILFTPTDEVQEMINTIESAVNK